MKKVVLILGIFLLFNIGIGFAAPVNELEEGTSAGGIMWGTHSTTYYAETKPNETLTVGVQYVDWRKYDTSVKEIYGRFDVGNNLKLIIGTRNFDDIARAYAGLAQVKPVGFGWNIYASAIAGDNFKEVQVGASYELSENTNLDFNYDFFRHKEDRDSLSFGLTYKM